LVKSTNINHNNNRGPHVVALFGVIDDEDFSLVMEFLEKGNSIN